jgi:hypothetical protein
VHVLRDVEELLRLHKSQRSTLRHNSTLRNREMEPVLAAVELLLEDDEGPWPPRMQVATHLEMNCNALANLGCLIRTFALSSHSPLTPLLPDPMPASAPGTRDPRNCAQALDVESIRHSSPARRSLPGRRSSPGCR